MINKYDLLNQSFGKLTVISKTRNEKGSFRWLCQCSCGLTRLTPTTLLLRGLATSCGKCYNEVRFNKDGFLSAEERNNNSINNTDVCKIKIDINEILKEYESGLAMTQIASTRNISHAYISKKFKDLGIKSRENRKYFFNEDFFETIDTEEKAYWLGFITADGCVYRRTMKIAIISTDFHHLEKFITCIEGNQVLKYGKNNEVILECNSEKMVADLLKLGIGERKSLTVKPCKQVPKQLLKHYWRGMIDGDGCVFVKAPLISFVGTFEIVDAFRSFCLQYCNSKANIRSHGNIFQLHLGGKHIFYDLVKLFYTDCEMYLDRKKEAACGFIETYKPTNIRKSR